MVRDLSAALRRWMDDDAVRGVAIRGMGREAPFATFCAGGDIRFLHRAGHEGHPDLDAFFAEEYALNHLIHTYPKPYVAFMDGIVMGGGMGISQGAGLRIVTERTRMAMPETAIGFFPDVGGGYFLSRCPGHVGEWLALTGDTIDGTQALACGLADVSIAAAEQARIWDVLATQRFASAEAIREHLAIAVGASSAGGVSARGQIDQYFSAGSVAQILAALEASDDPWAQATAATLRKRSPLMLHVVLEQIRRARSMHLADDLRMELDMAHRCFHLRAAASESLEGIRALVIDKDHAPRWNPATVEAVTSDMIPPFFESPWASEQHPLRALR